MIYFDTSYIIRLYFEDPGWQRVRDLAATDHIACCLLGCVEALAAMHRKFREKSINHRELRTLLEQFSIDCDGGAFHWLPLSQAVVDESHEAYARLPNSVHLRAGDAVHLACAAENGFREIHSNDRRLLAAAPHFGLRGQDVTSGDDGREKHR